jgi:16S rRNA (cytosine967-C5)-methyltransferase
LSATPARQAALRVLRAVRAGDLADRSLRPELAALPARDRAWTQELVQGTLRLRARLDHRLTQFTRRPLASLDPDVLDTLRLGAYQLTEMAGVPAYAAVSQSVELVKPAGGAALVNAVLQSLRRAGAAAVEFPAFDKDAAGYLTTWGSHPRWLVERWIRHFGLQRTRRLVECDNTRPELYLRPINQDAPEAQSLLAQRGIEADVIAPTGSLRLRSPSQLSDALAAISAVVQDPAASAVVRYVSPPADSLVADLCAAPGGKAIGIAAGDAGSRPARVIAADISMGRLSRLSQNLERLPSLPIAMVVADARRPPMRSADVVLLDAPCTGTGTLRRHADGRWRVSEHELVELVKLQAEMLDAVASLVSAGGILVYATCSLEPEENEHQVDAFLARNADFAMVPPDGFDAHLIDERGMLRMLPQVHGFDGAFAARMRRREPIAR